MVGFRRRIREKRDTARAPMGGWTHRPFIAITRRYGRRLRSFCCVVAATFWKLAAAQASTLSPLPGARRSSIGGQAIFPRRISPASPRGEVTHHSPMCAPRSASILPIRTGPGRQTAMPPAARGDALHQRAAHFALACVGESVAWRRPIVARRRPSVGLRSVQARWAHIAPSNAAFDQSLRTENPEWGVRDVRRSSSAAEDAGLKLVDIATMPANNLVLAFARSLAAD